MRIYLNSKFHHNQTTYVGDAWMEIYLQQQIKCKVWLSLFQFSKNSEMFGHLQVEFLPDR
jgi:hypothetical protein